jgi:hypothetical protein
VKTLWGAFGLFIVPPVIAATMQWLVLRRFVAHGGWWLLASLLGFGMALPVFGAAFGMGVGLWGEESWLTLIVGCLAFGTVVGVPQWYFLKDRAAHAGWWIGASIVGLCPAIVIFVAVTRGFDVGIPGAAAAGALGGCLYGIVTGIVLVQLISGESTNLFGMRGIQ